MKSEEYYLEKLKRFSDSKDRIFERPEIPEDIKNIHITPICGKAMTPLAGLLTLKGYNITGSDSDCFPPMSNVLAKLNIKPKEFNIENVKTADVLVVGNACTPSNVEASYARENNLPQMSISEALHHFIMKDKTRLVVSGTHGKTTTTGLLAHIFEEAGREPGFSIGGTMRGKDETYALGEGDYFIIEGDEYNISYFDRGPKFLSYKAHGGIVNSLEYDHVDIYDDFNDYKQAFVFFVEAIPEDGHLMLWGDDENVRSLSTKTKANVHTFGFGKDNEFVIENVVQGDGQQTFDLFRNGESIGSITTTLPGDYNLLNIVSASGLALSYGIDFETVRKAITSFKGMKKRQEILYENHGIILMDDYAHHPTAVDLTIKGLRKHYPNRRIIAVFEPRNNASRRKAYEGGYSESLAKADIAILKQPPFLESDIKEDFMDTKVIVENINKSGGKAFGFENVEDIIDQLLREIQGGDLILTMSSGSFDNLQDKLIKILDTEK